MEAIFSIEKNNIHKIVETLISPSKKKTTEDPLLTWLKSPVDGDEDTDSVLEHDVMQ